MKLTCETCAYFEANSDVPPAGHCHFMPPQPSQDYRFGGQFPRVEADDWCGQHSALQMTYPEHDPNTGMAIRLLRALPENKGD